MKILFVTECWEGNWRPFLLGRKLQEQLNSFHYTFDETILLINNINLTGELTGALNDLVNTGTISRYIFVKDYEDDALQHFNISKNSFEGGFHYSNQIFTSIYLAHQLGYDYIFHCTTDCKIIAGDIHDFIQKAVKLISGKPDYLCAIPAWNSPFDPYTERVIEDIPDFFVSTGMTDQCFLAEIKKLNGDIYDQLHPDGIRYPLYAGNSFEKRINAYMKNNEKYLLVSKDLIYKHEF